MSSACRNEILNQFVARRLVQYRIRSGTSQEKLAERLGLNFEAVLRAENGLERLEDCKLAEACELFGMSIAAFFHGYSCFEEQFQFRQARIHARQAPFSMAGA